MGPAFSCPTNAALYAHASLPLADQKRNRLWVGGWMGGWVVTRRSSHLLRNEKFLNFNSTSQKVHDLNYNNIVLIESNAHRLPSLFTTSQMTLSRAVVSPAIMASLNSRTSVLNESNSQVKTLYYVQGCDDHGRGSGTHNSGSYKAKRASSVNQSCCVLCRPTRRKRHQHVARPFGHSEASWAHGSDRRPARRWSRQYVR